MHVASSQADMVVSRPRFFDLMSTYETAFDQLMGICGGFVSSSHTHFVSVAGDPRIALYLDLLERHPYTSVLRMTYIFAHGRKVSANPNAFLRVYHDARQVELTFCEPGRVLGGMGLWGQRMPRGIPSAADHHWRRARFLDRWLTLLRDDGRSWQDFLPVERSIETRLQANLSRPFQQTAPVF